MNIAFFIKPKSRVAYLVEGSSFRQGLEKLTRHGYSAIPVISKDGRYLGSVSEGDFLWNIMSLGSLDTRDLEIARIDGIISDRNPPVRINASMEDLFARALDQNFIPVVDDRDSFMGIITRRSIISYFMNDIKESSNNKRRSENNDDRR